MTKRSILFKLRSSLWLFPLVALFLGIVGGLGFVQIDLQFNWELEKRWPGFLQPGPDGARQVLTIIGSSMITIAGVVFSITIVSLSLTANQYSPRVLRNFMRDRVNQTVLGVFVCGFVYSLVVLQAVDSGQEPFVPQVALWVGVLLAIASIIFLIVFIHHTATTIQVSEIVSHISSETTKAFETVKDQAPDAEPDFNEWDPEKMQWETVASGKSGFVQDVDAEGLYKLACELDVVVRVESSVGEFIVAGDPLVSFGAKDRPNGKQIKKVQGLFGIHSQRTIEIDPEFGVRQIVDIALRALSPGINDSSTAITCIDYLGVILRSAARVKPLPKIYMDGPKPRLVFRRATKEHLVDVAFDEIRRNAGGNVTVMLKLLCVLRHLIHNVDEPALRVHLRSHAKLVDQQAERTVPEPADRTKIAHALDRCFTVNLV